ncbi:unnamed protein product [Callosobruchus maculatus]|uniref:Uncharacterized protein n=1 Tax=Callosobruchus maculatus TaxID=64391 RepID=A0A653BIT3_CALMS|nr:unnamed protein product [Callosobruchus maculatus]
MLTAAEEEELLACLPISQECSTEEAEILLTLYESKLKKYQTPSLPRPNESKILYGNSNSMPNNKLLSSLNLTTHTSYSPMIPTSISTPAVTRNNDKNIVKSNEPRKPKTTPMDTSSNTRLMKLKNSLDLQVAEAERLYYNCDYQACNLLTEAILKMDPYHDACLPIHISCQVELKTE